MKRTTKNEPAIYLPYTGFSYRLNRLGDRLFLREDLRSIGFFTYPETQRLYSILEKQQPENHERDEFFEYLRIFSHIILTKGQNVH